MIEDAGGHLYGDNNKTSTSLPTITDKNQLHELIQLAGLVSSQTDWSVCDPNNDPYPDDKDPLDSDIKKYEWIFNDGGTHVFKKGKECYIVFPDSLGYWQDVLIDQDVNFIHLLNKAYETYRSALDGSNVKPKDIVLHDYQVES